MKQTNKNFTLKWSPFFSLFKLKPHFKDQYNDKLNTEEKIFKPQSNKKLTPNKNHLTIKHIGIEAITTKLKQQGDISGNEGYNNLFNGGRIALKELSDHTDTIIAKANKE